MELDRAPGCRESLRSLVGAREPQGIVEALENTNPRGALTLLAAPRLDVIAFPEVGGLHPGTNDAPPEGTPNSQAGVTGT